MSSGQSSLKVWSLASCAAYPENRNLSARVELSDNSVYYHIRPLKIEEVKSKVWDVEEGYPIVRAFLDTTSHTCTG